MIKESDITTGAERIFNELRNMPCPHLEYDYNDIKNDNHQDCNCKLGVWCIENRAENCPVIEALLVYIPWKREMLEEEDEEEATYREMARRHDEGDDLVESHELEKEDWGENMEGEAVEPEGWIVVPKGKKGSVIVHNTRMYPGSYYMVKRKNGIDDFVGEFKRLDPGGCTIRMCQTEGMSHVIDLNNIEKVYAMTYTEIRDYWRDDVKGRRLEVNHHYTIFKHDDTTFVGEFQSADAMYIRMWDGYSFEKILISNIKGIDDIH